MSVNWVMLTPSDGFTPLPGEQRLHSSPARTALSIQSINKYPGKQPFSLQSSAGIAYLTNRRLVYLPQHATPSLQSFAAPILNFHDCHVTAPFFGPNVWTGIVQVVSGGGLPTEHLAVEIKLTFKDGGAYDFHSTFERIKERLQQAVEVARESGRMTGDGSQVQAERGAGGFVGVDLDTVHLDQLPAYEAVTEVTESSLYTQSTSTDALTSIRQRTRPPHGESFAPPVEPPPGYETVQSQSVADEVEHRLRGPQ